MLLGRCRGLEGEERGELRGLGLCNELEGEHLVLVAIPGDEGGDRNF